MPLPLSEYPGNALGVPAEFPWDWLDGIQTSGLNVRAGTTPKCRPVNGTLVNGEVQFTPANAQEEQVLHAFYWCNFLHDFFYLYGFDEAAGNFQAQSKQPGGESGDALRAVVMEGSHPDPAFIAAVPDGTPPRLALHRFEGARHTAFDPDVIIHEYTHAVVERLCGGWLTWNVGATTAQGLALGEGLSDFFAMSLANYGLPRASHRVAFAAWVTGNATTGLRRHAYDEQFPGTFATLGTPGFQTSHEAGQVWAACLLAVIEQFDTRFADPARAARMTWTVVIDSVRRLRTGNGHPTFLDARDAILAALEHISHVADFAATKTDALVSDLWIAFRRFGMGPAALSPSASFTGLVADF
jgi:extracellular elastinolytic metalloproteinase